MSKAQALIEGASLGPDALKAACQAFDEAWASIAGQFHNPTEIEAVRLALASAILSVAADSSRDVEIMKHFGLQAMVRNYASGHPFAADVKLLDEKHWRDMAEEARRLANHEPDAAMKDGLLEVARGYDRLVELTRERTHPNGHTTMNEI